MKNYKKVLDELKQVSPNFYVGGSLSLYVFHYITRTPKDLDINSTDPDFLKMAKEMQELHPVPEDGRGHREHPLERELSENFGSYSVDDPPEMISYIIDSHAAWEIRTKEKLRVIKENNKWLAKTRNPFKTHASFLLHGVRVEVYANEVTQHHTIHGFQFVDPNEVLYYKEIYDGRSKDEMDLTECYGALYPERVANTKHGVATYYSLGSFKKQGGVILNDLPRHLIERVVSGELKPRSLAGYDKFAKVARKSRIGFLEKLKLSKEQWIDPEPNRYLSKEPKQLDRNTFKLYGISRNWPNVKLYKNFVLITNEYLTKVRISRNAFETLRQIPPSDVPVTPQLKKLGEIMWKLDGADPKFPVVRLNPSTVSITTKKGKVTLEREAFRMLKTINYGMIA